MYGRWWWGANFFSLTHAKGWAAHGHTARLKRGAEGGLSELHIHATGLHQVLDRLRPQQSLFGVFGFQMQRLTAGLHVAMTHTITQ
jgi:hypothetical protein